MFPFPLPTYRDIIMKKPTNYVNNKQFLELLKEYRIKKTENPSSRIPDSIGKVIILIANKLASRYNFQNYTYKDEMISDGILKAIEAVDNFDENKSSNPFAFFTQIVFNAFIVRIKKEKAYKRMQNRLILESDLYTIESNEDMVCRDDILGDFEVNY